MPAPSITSLPAGRVALVTGGARRVGRAVVERLAEHGFDVAFTYHASRDEAIALADLLRQRGRRALAIPADLTDPGPAAEAVVRRLGDEFGRLDLLVNNASVYESAGLDGTTIELARRMMTIHYEAPLLLCQKLAGRLRSAGGHIVNLADLLAERPWPQYLAYCASKAALVNLTLALARELAPEVTVNAIAPGVVAWPDGYPEDERQRYLKRVPLARPGTPDDVAALVLFLSTEGSYVTGQVLRLDGGRSIT